MIMRKYFDYRYVICCVIIFATPLLSQKPSRKRHTLWQHMQELYQECLKNGERNRHIMHQWCHDFWAATRQDLARIITRSHPVNFLSEPSIGAAMVRAGYNTPQVFEEIYLDSCISPFTQDILQHTSDTSFGNLPRTSSRFNCSTNTLGHLFYLAKVIEYASHGGHQPLTLNTIVEVGAGYGNLARLFKQALPDVTMVLIDLPEMSALQWFFLKSTLPEVKVVFHTDAQRGIVAQAINIIPLNLLDEFSFKTDVFISTFALSECSTNFQEYIAQRRFFEASLCYLSGQLNGLGNWVQHSTVFKNLHALYADVIAHPFHMVSMQLRCYEIIAQKLKE